MSTSATYRGVIAKFKRSPEEVQWYFGDLEKLLDFQWHVSIGYIFCRIEYAHRMTLYCGVVKKYRVNAELAWKAVNNHHLTRVDFQAFFKTIFGKSIPNNVTSELNYAEKVRDKIMHGQQFSGEEARKCVDCSIRYAA